MLPFRPYPLLYNGHLQTLLLGVYTGPLPTASTVSIQIDLEVDQSLLVHEQVNASLPDDAPIAILIHGLGGCHQSPYIQRIAHRLCNEGVRVWRVDLRGCGAGWKLAWQPAHAGCSTDLAAIIRCAQDRYPSAKLRIAGFSLGGNILLKTLGEAAVGEIENIDLSRIESALAVAPPVNLHDCAENMERLSRKVYTHYYVKILRKQAAIRAQWWPQWKAISALPTIKTIRQFDARYTAPLSGFRDTDDYYSSASSDQWLQHITVPTTILLDEHDPIVTTHSIPRAELNPAIVRLEFTRHGGHLGYLGRDEKGRKFHWMDYYVAEKLRATDSNSVCC